MIKAVHAVGLEGIELKRLRDRVGRLFDALQEATLDGCSGWRRALGRRPSICAKQVRRVTVRVELPGVTASQIKVGLTSTHLRICGEKKKRAYTHAH